MADRPGVRKLGAWLCYATVAICALAHVRSFFTMISWVWIVAPFAPLGGALICDRMMRPAPRLEQRRKFKLFVIPRGRAAVIGAILLAYSLILFVHFYVTSGGATNVEIVNGQYVYMSGDRVIRAISEQEYRMFPTHVVRIMSAWIAMMGVFGLASFTKSVCEDN